MQAEAESVAAGALRPQAPAAAKDTPREAHARWRHDLLVLVCATLSCYFLSTHFELFERLTPWLARHESWQLDEVPLTLLVLALGLTWFALRRRRETSEELALRMQAQAEVSRLLQHNRDLAQRLIGLQESERRAIARELHDEVGQACTAIRAEAAFIRHCDAPSFGQAQSAALRADRQAEHLYGLVHDMLERLRPANLDTLGLVAALQELCEAWEERSAVACVFHHEGAAEPLGDSVEIAVYRVAQEALTNVARHASASTVRMRLTVQDGLLRLTVQDDGRGIVQPARPGGLGLLGASERAAALDGTLSVGDAPGGGVLLSLQLPLQGTSP